MVQEEGNPWERIIDPLLMNNMERANATSNDILMDQRQMSSSEHRPGSQEDAENWWRRSKNVLRP